MGVFSWNFFSAKSRKEPFSTDTYSLSTPLARPGVTPYVITKADFDMIADGICIDPAKVKGVLEPKSDSPFDPRSHYTTNQLKIVFCAYGPIEQVCGQFKMAFHLSEVDKIAQHGLTKPEFDYVVDILLQHQKFTEIRQCRTLISPDDFKAGMDKGLFVGVPVGRLITIMSTLQAIGRARLIQRSFQSIKKEGKKTVNVLCVCEKIRPEDLNQPSFSAIFAEDRQLVWIGEDGQNEERVPWHT